MPGICPSDHHALEMTIAPNPFLILTWWATHTEKIGLGTAVVVAPYWNPIDLAGEAAFTDLISGGRLEFGIGSGAYQREFDRMHPGLKQPDAWRYLHEMLPALKALWAGDYEHIGEFWSFPTATSVPKPIQKPHPPIWVAARAPITFDYAVKHGCNIMSWPLTRPFSEVELYKSRLDEAMEANPGAEQPVFAIMRHTALYDNEDQWEVPIKAAQRQLGQFENLFKNLGDVIAKLKRYEELGVDEFIYYASMGLGHKDQKRSLELFCSEVIPAFA
jgi:alkanesulfonate monooxygenase SsuD/methylene tetrahydromethanopterin reductase-like flavin-dependent oxidoreductase (luciferase family)